MLAIEMLDDGEAEDGIAENDSHDEVVGFVEHIRGQADESHAEEAGRTKTIYLRARRGYGAVTSTYQPNFGTVFVRLKPWEERHGEESQHSTLTKCWHIRR